jgi:hypothetical protein
MMKSMVKNQIPMNVGGDSLLKMGVPDFHDQLLCHVLYVEFLIKPKKKTAQGSTVISGVARHPSILF